MRRKHHSQPLRSYQELLCAALSPGGGGPRRAGRYMLDSGLCQALRVQDCV